MYIVFQHTATRRWLHCLIVPSSKYSKVSTHSHPKVAASFAPQKEAALACFNTQPPEGGCNLIGRNIQAVKIVSTHSHPKVAAFATCNSQYLKRCFNTQPPEGGCFRWCKMPKPDPSFNTQPPEGGCIRQHLNLIVKRLFQHTATRRWLHNVAKTAYQVKVEFQHTATRRWLLMTI